MGRQIIKQPNGKYSVFSTVCDGFIWTDCHRNDLIDLMMEEKREEVIRHVDSVLEKLDKGEKPYHQFTMSWEEAMEVNNETEKERESRLG